MNPKALKYILDIESVIREIELIQVELNNDFSAFKSNLMAKEPWSVNWRLSEKQ